MAIDNSIIFGGVNSADFGIYISGEGVFNAPERDVEMIEIPGRNGALALDKGRFKNISVTYPAFNYEPNDYDTFAERLADFRNAICAQRGYQRLEDTFHPDEYRMAAYVKGLEIKPIKYNTASEFDLVFDCKPQRWLKSGETAVTVASGDVLTNPTRFESGPVLEVDGYGTIVFNGYEIDIENTSYGNVVIHQRKEVKETTSESIPYEFNDLVTFSRAIAYTDDIIQCDSIIFSAGLRGQNPTLVNATKTGSGFTATNSIETVLLSSTITLTMSAIEFHVGVAETKKYQCSYTASTSGDGTYHFESVIELSYDGSERITIGCTSQYTGSLHPEARLMKTVTESDFVLESTKSVIENVFYIDAELGEAYQIEGGQYISLNRYIDLGSDLPKLGVGANEITFDDTITELKVHPRWWKV